MTHNWTQVETKGWDDSDHDEWVEKARAHRAHEHKTLGHDWYDKRTDYPEPTNGSGQRLALPTLDNGQTEVSRWSLEGLPQYEIVEYSQGWSRWNRPHPDDKKVALSALSSTGTFHTNFGMSDSLDEAKATLEAVLERGYHGSPYSAHQFGKTMNPAEMVKVSRNVKTYHLLHDAEIADPAEVEETDENRGYGQYFGNTVCGRDAAATVREYKAMGLNGTEVSSDYHNLDNLCAQCADGRGIITIKSVADAVGDNA